jgi:hypothetical protein
VQVVGSRIIFDALLGRGATIDQTRMLQQWPLPVNFFCGMDRGDRAAQPSALTQRVSDAFCCGLADLPAGDLRLVINQSRYAPVIDIRSDLWAQARGVGPWELGATFYWAVGRTYRESIRNYNAALLKAGITKIKHNSDKKNAVIASAHFSTWGAQLAMKQEGSFLDQNGLETIYDQLRKSGMKSNSFIVDDRWEDFYGSLEHSASRLPKFEEFLDRMRKDGVKVGLWAAFLRCEDPVALGLDTGNMMRDSKGVPVKKSIRSLSYYLLDVSQPKVQEVLTARIKKFMRRYRPDVVKFDFGYEYPLLSVSAPKDMSWAGERFFHRAFDIISKALRIENPDVVIMYYSLSPLFTDFFDIHSVDDLFHHEEEYPLEANRRMFFSSVLGDVGIPSYGSGGYDWVNADDIWFDNIASGPLGSLASFSGDPGDSKPSIRDLAKFNGLVTLTRHQNQFSVEPLFETRIGANAAMATSWVRYEKGSPVLVALRTQHFLGFGPVKANFMEIVRSDVKIVVASRDTSSIDRSNDLGIVPFGNGIVTIRHNGNERMAKVTSHFFGNKQAIIKSYPVINGALHLPLNEMLNGNGWVEWLHVQFVKK